MRVGGVGSNVRRSRIPFEAGNVVTGAAIILGEGRVSVSATTVPVGTILKKAANDLDRGHLWLWLFRIDIGGGQFLNYVNHPRSITYQSIQYDPSPIELGGIEQDGSGKLQQLVVRVGDAARVVQGYLEASDGLRGKPVIVRLVHIDPVTGLPDADYAATFEIDAVTSGGIATFVLEMPSPSVFPGEQITRDNFPLAPM